MNIYVLSDIHGHYDVFKKMLEKINFSGNDFMYILGDVIDRGPDGLQLILDIMERRNMELFLGNHELMMLNTIDYVRKKDQGLIREDPTDERLTPYELWVHSANGGLATSRAFYRMNKKKQDEIEKYLRSLRLIRRLKFGDVTYHLSHSFSLQKEFGTEVYYKQATKKQAEMIVWESLFDKYGDPEAEGQPKPFAYSGDTYIVGHVFTQRFNYLDERGKGRIFKSDNYRGYKVMDIDCGMALNSKSSRLGCISLNTGEEFYIDLMDT
ncbi:MAG: metallophosphoesterase [Lachnospiraceae bacterium]|nr:metallophosphoesterase [Lachnospiraceae bacterium]